MERETALLFYAPLFSLPVLLLFNFCAAAAPEQHRAAAAAAKGRLAFFLLHNKEGKGRCKARKGRLLPDNNSNGDDGDDR